MDSTDTAEKKTGSENPIKELARQPKFLAIITACMVIAAVFAGQPQIAMWIGFCFAAYSAIANDSIQTIGTFIASNKQRPWWHLWLFIGGVFVATMYYSWNRFGGPVHIDMQDLVEQGEPLSVSKDQAVLRITMQAEGDEVPTYREMKLDIEDGRLVDRESLGIDVQAGLEVTGVELGLCAPALIWDEDSSEWQADTKVDEPENACWEWEPEGLPEGAQSAPPLRQIYAVGTAPDSGKDWQMSANGIAVGTILSTPPLAAM